MEKLNVTNCGLPQLYSMLQMKFSKVFHLNLVNTNFTKKFFDKETKIEEIVVDYVIDMEMEDLPFQKIPRLRKIDLSWSGSSSFVLKKDALADIPHSTHLTIRSSNIEMLPDTLFKNSTNVQHVDFNHNGIKHVPSAIFKNLNKLQTIN